MKENRQLKVLYIKGRRKTGKILKEARLAFKKRKQNQLKKIECSVVLLCFNYSNGYLYNVLFTFYRLPFN